MAKRVPTSEGDADPLSPARSEAEWEAQGWSAESVPFSAAPKLETTVSIRFDPESALVLRRAARLSGRTKSEFVRQATLREAHGVIAQAEASPFVVRSVARPAPPTTGSAARDPSPPATRTSGRVVVVEVA